MGQVLLETLQDWPRGIPHGRFEVAKALVTSVYGEWYDHPPYTDLAEMIVKHPRDGCQQALMELEKRGWGKAP